VSAPFVGQASESQTPFLGYVRPNSGLVFKLLLLISGERDTLEARDIFGGELDFGWPISSLSSGHVFENGLSTGPGGVFRSASVFGT
jgi:hypothetical protein